MRGGANGVKGKVYIMKALCKSGNAGRLSGMAFAVLCKLHDIEATSDNGPLSDGPSEASKPLLKAVKSGEEISRRSRVGGGPGGAPEKGPK